jgi:hypothetical protein
MTIKKVIKKIMENLDVDEKDFYLFLKNEIKSFNNTYLLTRRFIEKIDGEAVRYLNNNKIKVVNKYHFYVSLGTKTSIILKEDKEWSILDYVEMYKDELFRIQDLNKEVVYDKDVEDMIKHNGFYYLMFITKLIKGDEDEKK